MSLAWVFARRCARQVEHRTGGKARSVIGYWLRQALTARGTPTTERDLVASEARRQQLEAEVDALREQVRNFKVDESAAEKPDAKMREEAATAREALAVKLEELRLERRTATTLNTELDTQAIEAAEAYESASVEKRLSRLDRGAKEQYAVVRLGVSTAILLEFEQALLATARYRTAARDTVLQSDFKVTIPATERVLISVRPALQIRPTDALRLQGRVFFKMRPGLLRDHRREAYLQGDYEAKTGDGLTLGVSVQWFSLWDNIPPAISSEQVTRLAAEGQFVRVDRAAQRQNGVRATFSCKFN
jgi:hypothetical protein